MKFNPGLDAQMGPTNGVLTTNHINAIRSISQDDRYPPILFYLVLIPFRSELNRTWVKKIAARK